MVKKKIDNRIRVMIENGVKLGHRTMFIIVGDKARDQVRCSKILKQNLQNLITWVYLFVGANIVRYVNKVNG